MPPHPLPFPSMHITVDPVGRESCVRALCEQAVCVCVCVCVCVLFARVCMNWDSLFFTDYHFDLLHVCEQLLAPGGRVLIVGPRRGKTTGLFLGRAQQSRLKARCVER